MSIQSSIMRASAKVQRKLFDHSIQISGRERKVIHFYTNVDKYGNEDIEILSQKSTTVYINYPRDLPIDRINSDTYEIGTTNNRVFMFDVLPIELFVQWKDRIEVNDFIVDFLYTEKNVKFPIILKTSEFLGRFSTDLIWAKFLCSPYRGIIPEEIKTYIDGIING